MVKDVKAENQPSTGQLPHSDYGWLSKPPADPLWKGPTVSVLYRLIKEQTPQSEQFTYANVFVAAWLFNLMTWVTPSDYIRVWYARRRKHKHEIGREDMAAATPAQDILRRLYLIMDVYHGVWLLVLVASLTLTVLHLVALDLALLLIGGIRVLEIFGTLLGRIVIEPFTNTTARLFYMFEYRDDEYLGRLALLVPLFFIQVAFCLALGVQAITAWNPFGFYDGHSGIQSPEHAVYWTLTNMLTVGNPFEPTNWLARVLKLITTMSGVLLFAAGLGYAVSNLRPRQVGGDHNDHG